MTKPKLRSVLGATPKQALYEYFTRLTALLGEPRAKAICLVAADAIRVHPAVQRDLGVLQQRWYDSIARGSPDYTVYESELYLAEAWYCWATYSRKYLAQLAKTSVLAKARRVVDLGCGAGYSTATLTQLAPDAEVFGTNVLVGAQGQLCRAMSDAFGFELHEHLREVGAADTVFASEYFEHFAAPLAHLHEVLSCCAPQTLVIANAFTSPSIGHFPQYEVDGATVDGATASRRFNAALKHAGYEMQPCGKWNNRPAVWVRRALSS